MYWNVADHPNSLITITIASSFLLSWLCNSIEFESTHPKTIAVVFDEVIRNHPCNIAGLSWKKRTVYLQEVSSSTLKLTQRWSRMKKLMCLYMSAPGEQILISLVVIRGRANGALVSGNESFFEMPLQLEPTRSDPNIEIKASHYNNEDSSTPIVRTEIREPERELPLFLILDEEFNRIHRHCIFYIFNVILQMNLLMLPIRLKVVLVELERWYFDQPYSPLLNGSTIRSTLVNVLHYRQNYVRIPHKVLAYFTGAYFESNIIGITHVNGIQQPYYSAFVASVGSQSQISQSAATAVHELGHMLGLRHDRKECRCSQEYCLMHDEASNFAYLAWSDCSMRNITQLWTNSNGWTYSTDVTENPRAICGNLIKERGEECDNNFKSRNGVKCCFRCSIQNELGCEIKSRSRRQEIISSKKETKIQNDLNDDMECSEVSRIRTFEGKWNYTIKSKPSGSVCDENKGVCYNGKCKSLNRQCSKTFGSDWKAGSDECFDFNTYGTRESGYCSYSKEYNRRYSTYGIRYHPCKPENKLCGVLHCERTDGVLARPDVQEHTYTKLLQIAGEPKKICAHMHGYNRKAIKRDVGLVENGTPCVPGMFCYHGECQSRNNRDGLRP